MKGVIHVIEKIAATKVVKIHMTGKRETILGIAMIDTKIIVTILMIVVEAPAEKIIITIEEIITEVAIVPIIVVKILRPGEITQWTENANEKIRRKRNMRIEANAVKI